MFQTTVKCRDENTRVFAFACVRSVQQFKRNTLVRFRRFKKMSVRVRSSSAEHEQTSVFALYVFVFVHLRFNAQLSFSTHVKLLKPSKAYCSPCFKNPHRFTNQIACQKTFIFNFIIWNFVTLMFWPGHYKFTIYTNDNYLKITVKILFLHYYPW